MSFEITVGCLIRYDNQHIISEIESSVILFSNPGGSEEIQGEGRRDKMLAETFPLTCTENTVIQVFQLMKHLNRYGKTIKEDFKRMSSPAWIALHPCSVFQTALYEASVPKSLGHLFV